MFYSMGTNFPNSTSNIMGTSLPSWAASQVIGSFFTSGSAVDLVLAGDQLYLAQSNFIFHRNVFGRHRHLGVNVGLHTCAQLRHVQRSRGRQSNPIAYTLWASCLGDASGHCTIPFCATCRLCCPSDGETAMHVFPWNGHTRRSS